MEKNQRKASAQSMPFDSDIETVLNAVPQPVFVKDEQFRFRYVNEAACAFLGGARRDLIGRTDYDIRSAFEATRIRESDNHVLCTGEAVALEEEIVLPDGAVRTVMTHKRRTELTTGPAGNVVVTTILDVTAQRRAEADLQASQEHHRALIELHPQVPWTADPSGEVLEMGPRWKVTGFDPADALGTRWAQAMHRPLRSDHYRGSLPMSHMIAVYASPGSSAHAATLTTGRALPITRAGLSPAGTRHCRRAWFRSKFVDGIHLRSRLKSLRSLILY